MSRPSPLPARRLVIASALVAWAGLAIQLYCTITSSLAAGKSVGHAIELYFSFFTILTNILVAVALTAAVTPSRSAVTDFFRRPGVNAALAANIILVGITYNLLLRRMWNPQGWQWVADNVLHCVTPVLFVVCWWLTARKDTPHWSDVWSWTLYPIAYCGYALARGAVTGVYPYFFIDAGHLGLSRALLNSLFLLVSFLILCALVLAAADRRNRPARAQLPAR